MKTKIEELKLKLKEIEENYEYRIEQPNMLIKAAVGWWENKRPIQWMVETHLEHPTVNCFNDAERILAVQVANYVGEQNG